MAMMACPKCGHTKSGVVDSRKCADGIRRRRECENCGERWTTYEFPEEDMQVIKKIGKQMGIKMGMEEAIKHLNGIVEKIDAKKERRRNQQHDD